MKKQKIPMTIISTQIPEEIADVIKAQAESLEVTPAWLIRKIIKSYIDESVSSKVQNNHEINDIDGI